MKAVVLRGAGEIALEDFDEPTAGTGEVVVDVSAAGLNPVDLSRMDEAPLPSVPGNEGVGRLADRTRVYFERSLPPFGSFAQRALVDERLPIPLPAELRTADALTIGIAGLAGWLSLSYCARIRPGESVLVLGASGPVGHLSVQAAKLLGADRVVAAARDRAALAVTAAGARVVSLGASAGSTATITRSTLYGRSLLSYGNRLTPVAVKRAAYERMCRHVLAGELTVAPTELVALGDFADAFARQAAHPHRKLVLVCDPGEPDLQ
jgi:NADPH:quinone reductase-like Zn-dependent oxidoreductase